jgi:hypothetical protein
MHVFDDTARGFGLKHTRQAGSSGLSQPETHRARGPEGGEARKCLGEPDEVRLKGRLVPTQLRDLGRLALQLVQQENRQQLIAHRVRRSRGVPHHQFWVHLGYFLGDQPVVERTVRRVHAVPEGDRAQSLEAPAPLPHRRDSGLHLRDEEAVPSCPRNRRRPV